MPEWNGHWLLVWAAGTLFLAAFVLVIVRVVAWWLM